MAKLVAPQGFSLGEHGSVYWLEARMGRGVVRFSLAHDREGRELDLGLSAEAPGDHADQVTANRVEVARAMGFDPGSVRVVDQVHGAVIRSVSQAEGDVGFVPAVTPLVRADGMVSRDDLTVLAVSVADCAAVAISGSEGRALLHCGWRGLATDMIECAVEMVEGSDAIVGPCIGPCCYEVGPDVSHRLGVERSPGGTIDISTIAINRLEAAGVRETRRVGLCTRCNDQHFYSFRREGAAAGRQMAFFSPD